MKQADELLGARKLEEEPGPELVRRHRVCCRFDSRIVVFEALGATLEGVDDRVEDAAESPGGVEEIFRGKTNPRRLEAPAEGFVAAPVSRPHLAAEDALEDLQGEVGTRRRVDGPLEGSREG